MVIRRHTGYNSSIYTVTLQREKSAQEYTDMVIVIHAGMVKLTGRTVIFLFRFSLFSKCIILIPGGRTPKWSSSSNRYCFSGCPPASCC